MNRFFHRIEKEIATLRRLDKTERCYYIWDYYKFPILVIGLTILLVSTFCMSSNDMIDPALHVVLINAENQDNSRFTNLLRETEESKLPNVNITDTYSLDMASGAESNIATMQVLAGQFAVGDMDLFVADEDAFEVFAVQNGFADLGGLLPQELLAQLGNDVYCYVNDAGLKVIAGLWLHEGSLFHRAGYYHGDVLVGIVASSQNLEEASSIVEFLIRYGATE